MLKRSAQQLSHAALICRAYEPRQIEIQREAV
jgi:hypothetical protein